MDAREQCLALATQLHSEHQRLRAVLEQVRTIWRDASASEGAARRLPDELASLRQALESHFEVEELDGCLAEAVSRRPSLAEALRHLEQEHPALLDALDEIRAQVLRSGRPSPDMQRRLERFAQQLIDHEVAENQLLEQGFNVSLELGTQEVPQSRGLPSDDR